MSNWKAAHFCVNCNEILASDERFGNSGVCPKCGYKDSSAHTIVRTYTKAYRRVRIASWWNIIRIGRKFKIVWKDEEEQRDVLKEEISKIESEY